MDIDMKYALLLLCALSFSSFSSDKKLNDTSAEFYLSSLYLAKMTGLCGSFRQMLEFQQTTQLPGGDNFVVRFIKVESARLGKTSSELLNHCKEVISTYENTVTAIKNR